MVLKALIDDFLCNNFQHFDLFFEHLLLTGDEETVVMKYAHGDCHHLTLALLKFDSSLKAIGFHNSEDEVIHSAISNNYGQVLDSNGVHSLDDCEQYWSAISGDSVEIKPMDESDVKYMHDHLTALHGLKAGDLESTLREFELILPLFEERLNQNGRFLAENC